MAGPWERYQTASSKPWEKYQPKAQDKPKPATGVDGFYTTTGAAKPTVVANPRERDENLVTDSLMRSAASLAQGVARTIEEAPSAIASIVPERFGGKAVAIGGKLAQESEEYKAATAPATEGLRDKAAALRQRAGEGQYGGFFEEEGIANKAGSVVETILDSSLPTIGGLAVGAVTRNPYAAGAIMAGGSAPVVYDGIRERQEANGTEDYRAAVLGTVVSTSLDVLTGVGRGVTNVVDRGEAAKLIEQGFMAAVKRVGMEGGEESVTEALQTVVEQVAGGEDPTTKQALMETLEGGIVGFFGGGAFGTVTEVPRGIDKLRQRRAGAPAQPGTVSTVREQAAQPTEEDVRSPLPTEDIAAGKAIIAEAEVGSAVNEDLKRRGLPELDSRISITSADGDVIQGRIVDVFEADGGGFKLEIGEGIEPVDYYLNDIQDAGDVITPLTVEGVDAEAERLVRESEAALAEARSRAPVAAPEPIAPAIPAAPISQAAPVASDPNAIDGFMAKARRAESGGKDGAKNPRSSATGRYQFIESTFKQVYRQVYGGDANAAQQAWNSQRNDPNVQEALMRRLTGDNAKGLERAGIPVTEGNLYLAHFAGIGGAINVYRQRGKSAEEILGAGVVNANPFLRGMTGDGVIQWAAGKMGGKAPPSTAGVAPTTEPQAEEDAFDNPFTRALERYREATQETSEPVEPFQFDPAPVNEGLPDPATAADARAPQIENVIAYPKFTPSGERASILEGRPMAGPEQATFAQRKVSQAELDDAIQAGVFKMPESGETKHGVGKKWWTPADESGQFGRVWGKGGGGALIRVPIGEFSASSPISTRTAEVWSESTKSWVPLAPLSTDTVPQAERTSAATAIELYHGGRKGMSLDDVQIVREPGATKQGKNNRVFGGFYATNKRAEAEGYANMAEDTTVYKVELKPGSVIENKEGDITRLSPSLIEGYRERGVDVVVGKDPRGRTEYAIINKDAVADLVDTQPPSVQTEPVAGRPGVGTQPVRDSAASPVPVSRTPATEPLTQQPPAADAVSSEAQSAATPRVPPLGPRENSWIITDRETGEAVFETTQQSVAEKVNQDRYEVRTAGDYLGSINGTQRTAPVETAPITPFEAAFNSNPERALAELPEAQLKEIGSRLGVKRLGKGGLTGFVERIASNPIADVRTAALEVVQPVAPMEAAGTQGTTIAPATAETTQAAPEAPVAATVAQGQFIPGVSTNTPMTPRNYPIQQTTPDMDMVRFVAANGGLSFDGLNEQSRTGKKLEGNDLRNTAGLKAFVPRVGPLLRRNGKSLDEMGEALWEAGYFTERPTERQVIDALSNSLRTGQKVMPGGGAIERQAVDTRSEEEFNADISPAAAMFDMRNRWDEAAAKFGMDPLFKSEIDTYAARFRQRGAFDPDTATVDEIVNEMAIEAAEEEARFAEAYYSVTTDPRYDTGNDPFAYLDAQESRPDGVRDEGRAPDAGTAQGRGDVAPQADNNRGNDEGLDLGAAVDPAVAERQRTETQLRADAPLRGTNRTGQEQDGTMGLGLFDANYQPALLSVPEADTEATTPADVTAALETQLEGLGLKNKVRLEVAKTLGGAAGRFTPGQERLIQVATDTVQDEGFTLNHEGIHALRDMGVFTPAEWAMLSARARREDGLMRSIKRRYPRLDTEAQTEEAVADMFARYQRGDYQAKGVVDSVFKTLTRLMEALRNVFAGRGLRTADGVMADVASGAVGAREGGRGRGGDPRDMVVYQGSPTRGIEQMSTDFMGTGEGAQAFGWGLYFASKKALAQFYRDKLTGRKPAEVRWNGKDYNDLIREYGMNQYTNEMWDALEVLTTIENARTFEETEARLKKRIEEGPSSYSRKAESMLKWLQDNRANIEIKSTGGLYTVDIPEDGEYLLWDKRLSEQPETVQAALRSMGVKTDGVEPWSAVVEQFEDDGVDNIVATARGPKGDEASALRLIRKGDVYEEYEYGRPTGREIPASQALKVAQAAADSKAEQRTLWDEVNTSKGGDFYKQEMDAADNGKALSMRLRAAGIKGIKYLDGNSRADGDGSYNYVIFDGADTRILAKDSIPETVTPQAILDLAGQDPTWKGDAAVKYETFRNKFQDNYYSLKRAERLIERYFGRAIPENMKTYMSEEVMHGRMERRLNDLLDNQIRPMYDAMAENGITIDELDTFLMARFAPERNASIAKINPKQPDGGSGMTNTEARAILARVARSDKADVMNMLAARAGGIRESTLDYQVEYGLISAETAAAYRQESPNYVPLRGFADLGLEGAEGAEAAASAARINRSGGGINVSGRESRAAYGRRSKADSPFAYLILQAQEAVIRGETNRVAQSFVRLAEASPDKRFWEVNKITSKRRRNPETGEVEDYVTNQLLAADKDFTIVAKFDGKERRVTLNRNNPAALRLADSMRRLSSRQLDMPVKFFGAALRLWSAMNTRWSAEFLITNGIRDLETALINTQGIDADGITKRFSKYYLPAMKASFKGARGNMDGEMGRWYDEFTAEGGKTAFNQVLDIDALKKEIEGEFDLAKSRAGTDKRVSLKARRMLNATVGLVEDLNDAVENAARLAVYRAAREGGLSKMQSASLAKNITVNFNRKGQFGPFLNSFYGFFNASVQGNVRTLQGYYYSPRIRKVAMGIAVAGVSMELLNALITGDDDDGESFYDKIPAFEKERNIIIMYGQGPNDYLKIPMAYGHNAFFEMGRTAAEIMRRGGDRWQESAGNFVNTVVNSYNPVSFDYEGRSGFEAFASFLMPTLGDIPLNLGQNRDFVGNPIMPEAKFGPQDPDAQRYYKGVSPIWKSITDGLTELTGGNKVEAGLVDVSPETLDYMADNMFGAALGFFNKAAAMPAKMMSGEMTTNDAVFLRKFMGAKSPYYDKGVFYNRLEEIEARLKTGKELAEAEMTPELQRFVDDHRAVLTLEPEFKEAQKLDRQIRKEKRASEAMLEKGLIDQEQHDANVEILTGIENELVLNFNRRWVETVYKGDNEGPIE